MKVKYSKLEFSPNGFPKQNYSNRNSFTITKKLSFKESYG